MKVKNFKLLIVSIILCQVAGLIGSLATSPAIPGWYAELNKPAFNPPNWIFGPVWITLYTLMGISLSLIWSKGLKNKKALIAIRIFLLHLVINSLWSIVFFGLKNLLGAFILIIILWLMIAYLIKLFWKIKKTASFLLVPYLFWVTFAAILNYSILTLN